MRGKPARIKNSPPGWIVNASSKSTPSAARSRRSFLRCLGGAGSLVAGFLLGDRDRSDLTQLFCTPFSPRIQEAPPGAMFVDVAAEAGLNLAPNVYGGATSKRYLLEEMGGGAAFFDYDNDGWLDIFLVNGTTLEGFPPGRGPSNYLFHNNRDGTFTDVTEKAGLIHSGWGQGCCVGDYDNDGYDDLFVTYWGQNVLYHNNGDGTFTDVTAKAGLVQPGPHPRWNTGACFVDYDRDGHLDLFVANYVNFDPHVTPLPGENRYCVMNAIPVACGPHGLSGGTNILYHNGGDGTFEDVTEKAGISNPRGPLQPTSVDANWKAIGSYGFTAVAVDFDNDGWPDIYVACDAAPSLLYHNNHDGTFSEIGVIASCAFSQEGLAQAGMGVGVADYDCDGWFDIVKTNFSDDSPNLYHNEGDGTFFDVTQQAGLGLNTKYVGMGVGFLDYDNDGWKDVFIANGHVYPEIDSATSHITYREPKLLYRNLGNGRFADVSSCAGPGITEPCVAHGCAFGDFDNDGDVDILINNQNGPPSLLRSDRVNKNSSVQFKCIGTRSNRSAIGARVKVVTGSHVQVDEVLSGSSFLSQNDLRLYFGLGDATVIDLVEVHWPSGLSESFRDLPVNRLIYLKEGQGILKTSEFQRR